MTYEEITKALRFAKCDSTADALSRAVEEEKYALWKYGGIKYRKRDGGRAALAAARDFYAEDITNHLRSPVGLHPEQILSHRRLPTAWAIAEIMRREGIVPPTLAVGEVTRNWPLYVRSIHE